MKKMKKNDDGSVEVLHCGPCFGRRSGGGGRERSPLYTSIQPVNPCLTVISLPSVCLVAGLLGEWQVGKTIHRNELIQLAQDKWNGSVARFQEDASRIGTNFSDADKLAATLRGAVIGWSDQGRDSCRDKIPRAYCHDLNWTIAILSRRVGDMFIAARNPDYSWENLFGVCFEFDDDIVPVSELTKPPWSRFQWQENG